MPSPTFSPGFRISVLDVAVLVVGSAGAIGLAAVTWWWGYVLAFVVGHFFLFCNVIRLARPLELAWAGIFLALAAATIMTGMPGWTITAAGSMAATGAVVLLEMRKPSYHGVGWRRINPNLPVWWEANVAAEPGLAKNL